MKNFIKEWILNSPFQRVTYSEYINLALYHPQYGYYMRDKCKIGREGDFITTSNISDIYGRSIAKWFYKQVSTKKLTAAICEIGAGTGRFARAFIDEWNQISTEPIQYFILEESPHHRKLQQDEIVFSESVKQIDRLMDIYPFTGLIFSNELFDAFPVHVIENQNEQLMEIMITVKDDQLTEISVPLEDEQIIAYIEESELIIKDGQRIEIPLQMGGMIGSIASVLAKGMVLTVDYGYTNEEWQQPLRREGSLRGYYQHQQMNNILLYPGEMDITSHIHFDAFIRQGSKHGLQFIKKWRQDEFLLESGILDDLQDHYDPNPFSEVSKKNRAIRSLIMPCGISSSFHVILQEKEYLEK